MLSFDAICNTQTNTVEVFVHGSPAIEHITRVRVLVQNEQENENCEENNENNSRGTSLLDLLDEDHWLDGLFHGNNKFVFRRPLTLSTCSIMWCLLEVKEMHISTASKVIQCALCANYRKKELEEEEEEIRDKNVKCANYCKSNTEGKALRRDIAETIRYEVYLVPFTVEKVVGVEEQKSNNNNSNISTTSNHHHAYCNECNVYILHGVAKSVVNCAKCDNNSVSSESTRKANNKMQSQEIAALHKVKNTLPHCQQLLHLLQLEQLEQEEEQHYQEYQYTKHNVSATPLMMSDIHKLRNLVSLHSISKLVNE